MNKIKKLAGNIFFKIFIGFLVLSFAFFGVSSFLLGSSGSWVAKVGDEKISINKLQKTMMLDREAVLRANPNNSQALEYVNSSKFRFDVLNRLVNQVVVNKLRERFEVNGDRKLILEMVAKDPNFNKNGKFDRKAFQYFLAQNGLDEEKYIKEVQNEVATTMVINSLSIASVVDPEITQKIANLREEKRIADVIYISEKNVVSSLKISDEALKEYYEKNKQKFVDEEKRNISYITFSNQDLIKNVDVSEAEIKSFYEKNQENYKIADAYDFYHILFSDEKRAQNFLKELNNSNNKIQDFIKIAKKLENKDEKTVFLSKIKQKDLLPDLSNKAFSLQKNQNSEILKSPLGFHIFLLKDIHKGEYVELAKVKNEIKTQILEKKKEEFLQNKISEINNFLIKSNSLIETAKKFGAKNIKSIYKINEKGFDINGKEVNEIKSFDGLLKYAFLSKEKQTSQLYFSNSNNLFYAINVEKIEKSREKTFDEVKNQVAKIYQDEQKQQQVKELANKIADEIKQNPQDVLKISAKYGLKLEREKIFPRTYFIEYNGQKIPYSDKFLDELFSLQINKVGSPSQNKNSEFQIAILRKIKEEKIDEQKLMLYKKELANIYRNEFVEELNKFLQKKYPIKINEKLLKQFEKEQE